MDGIGIIILAIVVILSTFNDKKKRPKQHADGQPAPKPFDPFGQPGSLEHPNRPTAPTTPAPAPVSAKPAQAVRPAMKPKTAAKPAAPQSEPRIYAAPDKAENSEKTAPETAGQPTAGVMAMTAEARHEVLQEFDPKLAILYGEIMQPKFQEYE